MKMVFDCDGEGPFIEFTHVRSNVSMEERSLRVFIGGALERGLEMEEHSESVTVAGAGSWRKYRIRPKSSEEELEVSGAPMDNSGHTVIVVYSGGDSEEYSFGGGIEAAAFVRGFRAGLGKDS